MGSICGARGCRHQCDVPILLPYAPPVSVSYRLLLLLYEFVDPLIPIWDRAVFGSWGFEVAACNYGNLDPEGMRGVLSLGHKRASRMFLPAGVHLTFDTAHTTLRAIMTKSLKSFVTELREKEADVGDVSQLCAPRNTKHSKCFHTSELRVTRKFVSDKYLVFSEK